MRSIAIHTESLAFRAASDTQAKRLQATHDAIHLLDEPLHRVSRDEVLRERDVWKAVRVETQPLRFARRQRRAQRDRALRHVRRRQNGDINRRERAATAFRAHTVESSS